MNQLKLSGIGNFVGIGIGQNSDISTSLVISAFFLVLLENKLGLA